MFSIVRKLISIPSLFKRQAVNPNDTDVIEEKWVADFSKPKQARFDIKSESSYDANLRRFGSRHCLFLGLKKSNTIAWTEAPRCRCRDLVIQGCLHVDSRGGYAAGGILFRMLDEKTYYSFLISSKGYFRLDVVRNGMPLPLVAWTELPAPLKGEKPGSGGTDFTVIAFGRHLVLLIRGVWAAEITDTTVAEGALAFAAASYEAPASREADTSYETDASHEASALYEAGSEKTEPGAELLFTPWPVNTASPYTAEVFLESFSVESRFAEVSAAYEKWKDVPKNPQSLFHLAETFTAMGQYDAAMAHIHKAWEKAGHKKSQRELLLAGRLAQILGFSGDAETYISACFQSDLDSPEGREAVTEMAKILYSGERYEELKNYCAEALKIKSGDPLLFTFKGHADWNLKNYKEAAAAYDQAFELDSANGLLAKNAAHVYEAMGKKKEALSRFLAAGRAFLSAGDYNDLGILVPTLLETGKTNPEVHALAGKWAFGIEDWAMAARELALARSFEKRKRLSRDPAAAYLEALLLIRDGNRGEALPLLNEAVSLKPDYALFRFKLAENMYLLKNDPQDPALKSEVETALALDPDDGWIANFAAQLELERGNLDAAGDLLEIARNNLGDNPEVKVNTALLLAQRNSVDEALKLLAGDDGSGGSLYAYSGARILSEAGRYEEADGYYQKALAASPENTGYLFGRASCLIELGRYGEADTLLTKALSIEAAPSILEAISYVAVKKGEYLRAESACQAALDIDHHHVPSLLSLGWILANRGRTGEALEIIGRLDALGLSGIALTRRDELAGHVDNLLHVTVSCSSCGRSWRIQRDAPPARGIRLYAMPPDELPAGSCPECGKTLCIGCAKENLDESGRFICVECGKPLKLNNDGLKKIINDWAAADGLTKAAPRPRRGKGKETPAPSAAAKKLGRPSGKKPAPPEQVPEQPKRKRGRPRKNPSG